MALTSAQVEQQIENIKAYRTALNVAYTSIANAIVIGQQIAADPNFLTLFPSTGPAYISTYITPVYNLLNINPTSIPTEPSL